MKNLSKFKFIFSKKAIKAQQLEEKLEDKLKQFQELENEVVLLKASNRDIELKNIDFQNKLDLIKNQLNSKDSQIEKLLQSIMDHNSKQKLIFKVRSMIWKASCWRSRKNQIFWTINIRKMMNEQKFFRTK
jgi:hypothetical protein